MNAIETKVACLSTETLKEMATMLYSDMRDGAEIVLSSVLAQLADVMPESEFVAFCDTIA